MRAPARPFRPASILRHLPVEHGCAIVRDGDSTIVAVAPAVVRTAIGEPAFDVLREISAGGFWVGYCSYDLGRTIERVHERARDPDSRPGGGGLPDVAFARYDARIVLADDGDVEIIGDRHDRDRLSAAVRAAASSDSVDAFPARRPVVSGWSSSMDRIDHAAACATVLELLGAGDCYQVNVTRRLTAETAIDPIALYDALAHVNPAPHAMLCTFGARTSGPALSIVSASPELFLRVRRHADGTRAVETRPIKGTATDAASLARSAKDRAENVMIVDLARNDLGRVCEFGSIRVPQLCEIEAHPGLFHLVSTVTGELRPDVELADVIRATFPPASVTGAPKPRVMQAIEDLEPVRRGVYCGAVGWMDADADRTELAVAIRTFTITGSNTGAGPGRTHLGIGGGIVADSEADDEWAETELKAARLLAAIQSRGASPRQAAATQAAPATVGAP